MNEWLAHKAKPRIDSKKRTVKWGPGYQAIAQRTLVTAFNWTRCLSHKPRKRLVSRQFHKAKPGLWDRLLLCPVAGAAELGSLPDEAPPG